ncbi:MAG: 2-C-methyl-D-erythritol 4-phosphate cytidylyltransferase [Desulfamplus sp.]|nr:2-C-methyl-D-erythritol 4-phosphate cytidylyltransferase [Desulfamplus sp.]
MKHMKDCEIYAVIVAGGKGLRMGSEIRKQYIKISGIPVLARTLDIFSSFESIGKIVLVIPKDDMQYCFDNIVSSHSLNGKVCMVSGGSERQHSVMNGLEKVKELSCSKTPVGNINDSCHQKKTTQSSCGHSTIDDSSVSYTTNKNSISYAANKSSIPYAANKYAANKKKLKIVLIHDGVRPFVDHGLISRCIAGVLEHGACIPAVPVADTLKRKDSDGFVSEVVDRENLYQVQTPQAFDLDLVIKAHEQALISGISATDDASLVEKTGARVFMTSGLARNIKITTKEDLLFAEYVVSMGVKGYSC